jgi:FkbM family methyltransferase
MIFYNKIRDYFLLLKECSNFSGKIAIFIYFLQTPIFFIYKKTNHRFEQKLFFNVILKNEDGIFFCGKNMSSVRTASSLYEKELKKYFEINHGVFIDVGANIGKYSISLGKKLRNYGKVIAIEPESKNFKILETNIKLNKLKNIYPINIGCSSKNGKIKLFLDKEGTGMHSIKNKMSGDYQEIDVQKLDEILLKFKNIKISLIKIDVEGAEGEVLKGALKTLKKHHPKIIFEALTEEILEKSKNILKSLNYKIDQISKTDFFAHQM